MLPRRCARRRVKAVSAERTEAPEKLHALTAPPVGPARPGPRHLTPGGLLQLQRTLGNRAVGRLFAGARRENRTGLPDALKSGVERLSGLSLDGVRVHYDSPEPARLRAHAYTRGEEIHVAPGAERHLAHEAWHVVQQSQGRVPATARLKGVALNDDRALEREADVMGARALRDESHESDAGALSEPARAAGVLQAAGAEKKKEEKKDTSDEARPADMKNYTLETLDHVQLTYDPFDQTLLAVLPDGSGIQITYALDEDIYSDLETGGAEEKKEGEAAGEKDEPPRVTPRVTNAVLLPPMRVKALGLMAERQGGFQESAAGPAARRKADHKQGDKDRLEWSLRSAANKEVYDDYQQKLTEWGKQVAALPKGAQAPPAPPMPSVMPADPRTTLCNSFPIELGGVIGTKEDAGNLGNFDPAVEGARRGSWRTLETNPEGPKPGDVYSLGLPKNKDKIQHLGIFKSKRPGPDKNMETWTVVDGGQGSYEKRQTILERTRYFNTDTKILSTNLADAGQDPEDRSLRGWIDIEAHFRKKDETVST